MTRLLRIALYAVAPLLMMPAALMLADTWWWTVTGRDVADLGWPFKRIVMAVAMWWIGVLAVFAAERTGRTGCAAVSLLARSMFA